MSHEYSGYECAEFTLAGAAESFRLFRHPSARAIPLSLACWINPLLVLYLLSFAGRRLKRARPFLAAAIAVCCLAMWVDLLALEHVALLVGHYLWIAGMALILSAPLANRRSRTAFSAT